MADLNVGELVATTLRNRQPEMADNITNNNALLWRLEKKGNFAPADGGRTIDEPLMYAENTNAKWFDGYESFDIQPDDSIDLAVYDWKQLGCFATISGIESIKNSGRYAVKNLIKARVKVAEATLRNKAGLSIFSDGTGTGGKELGGLQLLVADDPTAAGTVGSIAQATNTFWQNQYSTSTNVTSSNVQSEYNSMYLNTCRLGDKTDLIISGNSMYTHYWTSLQTIQRITTSEMGEAGFMSLKFQNADVVFDENCNTNRAYFLNTDNLFFRCAPSRKFRVGKERQIDNADYVVVPIWFAGNITCSNRSLQGVIKDTT